MDPFKPLIKTSAAADILGVLRPAFAIWVSTVMPPWEGDGMRKLTPIEVLCFAAAVRIKKHKFLVGENSLVFCMRELPGDFAAVMQGDKSRAKLKLVELATGRHLEIRLDRIIADVLPKLESCAMGVMVRRAGVGQTNQLSGQNGRCRVLANAGN